MIVLVFSQAHFVLYRMHFIQLIREYGGLLLSLIVTEIIQKIMIYPPATMW